MGVWAACCWFSDDLKRIILPDFLFCCTERESGKASFVFAGGGEGGGREQGGEGREGEEKEQGGGRGRGEREDKSGKRRKEIRNTGDPLSRKVLRYHLVSRSDRK